MACAETETGLSFLNRVGTRPSLKRVWPELLGDLDAPSILEVTGDSGTGKSIICFDIIVRALLPLSWKGIPFGGCGTGVALVESDHHFSVLYFGNMLEQKIRHIFHSAKSRWKEERKLQNPDPNSKIDFAKSGENLSIFECDKKQLKKHIDSLIKDCMKRLVVLKCSESTTFHTTLLTLDEVILHCPNLALVVIDSLSSFYWYDHVFRSDCNWNATEKFYKRTLQSLLLCLKSNKLICLCVRQSLFRKKSNLYSCENELSDVSSKEVNYEYFGKDWSSAVITRIQMNLQPKTGNQTNPSEICININHRNNNRDKTFMASIHEDGIKLGSLIKN